MEERSQLQHAWKSCRLVPSAPRHEALFCVGSKTVQHILSSINVGLPINLLTKKDPICNTSMPENIKCKTTNLRNHPCASSYSYTCNCWLCVRGLGGIPGNALNFSEPTAPSSYPSGLSVCYFYCSPSCSMMACMRVSSNNMDTVLQYKL